MFTSDLLKTNRLSAIAIALCTALSFQSCSDDDDDYSMSNQQFVTQASSSNNFEVMAGNMAVSKGVNVTVKEFGQHMIDDHSAAGNELQILATQKNWTIPSQLAPKELANQQVLSTLSGAAFDKEFARLMVISHQDAVSLFEEAAQERGVPDGDLRNFAASKLPNLKMHLQGAVALKATVNP
jgi:putative membrane protein